ncbi:MAG: glycosyltransferase family 2 protein [Oscillospiraceae bacterium]|jgi:GT2 family glycosyltransferase|nr:glycosyltransferase family 2 protein [Oscillospiraceae bacterium]
MTDYTVSGSIVTHNNHRTIETTLRTLREQTVGVPFDLYIIDNCSKDDTLELVQRADPAAEILRAAKNVGFGAGHNTIRDRLTSKYHAIINPDIVLTQDAITAMAQYMDEHPEVAMLSPRIVFPATGEDQVLGKRNPTLRYLVASRRRRGGRNLALLREYAMLEQMEAAAGVPFEIQNATGCFMLLRTEIFQKVGGFDERFFLYFEDCDLTRTVARQGRVLYYPDAMVQHVWERESKKSLWLMLVQVQSMFRYFRKWKGTT